MKSESVLFNTKMFNDRTGSITLSNGKEIYMENRLKVFFSVLLNNLNDVVTRDELMELVWKDIVVSEESISKAVSDLRRFLQRNGIQNVKIATISKVGYKLEIIENQAELKQRTFVKKGLQIFTYLLIITVLIVIIIRALRYDQ